LNKEKETIQKQLDGVMARLNNKAFTDKAPAAVVENNRQTADRLREQLHLLDESLKQLG
jgi:valyl-tRNA synthetase